MTLKDQYAVLTTLSGAVASWRQQMYLLASCYALTKKKTKRINRDVARDQYIQTLISGREAECLSQLRMKTHVFHSLCHTLREKGLLRDTREVTVEEDVAEFMHTISHSVRNRTNSVRFSRSGETISRHFQAVLHAINQLAPEMLTQAGSHTLPGPYGFEGCVGALDGTHVPVHVPLQNHGAFRNRKGFLSQNILGACGFDMNFQYVLPDWEGSATDARVLHSALICTDPLIIPQGRYYLVDVGYANAPGFLAPYRAVKYHLSEFWGMNPQNERELYNKRHSQARNVIERTFGVLKNRFGILKTATQYAYKDQVSIVVACCVMHNYIRKNNGCDGYEDDASLDNEEVANFESMASPNECTDTYEACDFGTPQLLPLYSQRQRDEWHSFRDNIAMSMDNEVAMSKDKDASKSKGKHVKKYVTFDALMDEEMLDLMFEQVLLGRKADRGFKAEAYESVAAAMTEKSNGEYVLNGQSISNRCKHHKKNYSIATKMLNASGFGFDNTTKRIIASDDVWKAWLEGHPDAKPWKSKVIDYDKLTLIFGGDVATGQYARSATVAPSRQSSEGYNAGYNPFQADSNVGITSQFNACQMQSSGGETSSKRRNPRKRNADLIEIITRIEKSNVGLNQAILDVADNIRMPRKQAADTIWKEIRQIPELSGLDMQLAHEWLIIHQNMATVFLTVDDKRSWIVRQMPKIREERL